MNQTLTSNDRNWATYAHLAGFLVFLHAYFANVAAALFVYFKVKDESPFALQHARESVNFQLTYTLATFLFIAGMIVSYVYFIVRVVQLPQHSHAFPVDAVTLPFLFLSLYIISTLLNLIFCIFGLIAASDGRPYHYPLAIRFIR
jgi:uncharacterized protein